MVSRCNLSVVVDDFDDSEFDDSAPSGEISESNAPGPSGSDAPLLDSPISSDSEVEYRTLAQGFLSPRHRRLAQLAAEGRSNSAIAEELGYVGSRVSILLKNPHIAQEIRRLQDRIFEETIQSRLKSFAEPALNNIHMILTDNTNRVKIAEKAEMSKWVVEKLDGRPVQRHDVGENMLSVLLDRLDSRKTAPPLPQREVGSSPDIETKALPAPEPEKDELTSWVEDFCSES